MVEEGDTSTGIPAPKRETEGAKDSGDCAVKEAGVSKCGEWALRSGVEGRERSRLIVCDGVWGACLA